MTWSSTSIAPSASLATASCPLCCSRSLVFLYDSSTSQNFLFQPSPIILCFHYCTELFVCVVAALGLVWRAFQSYGRRYQRRDSSRTCSPCASSVIWSHTRCSCSTRVSHYSASLDTSRRYILSSHTQPPTRHDVIVYFTT